MKSIGIILKLTLWRQLHHHPIQLKNVLHTILIKSINIGIGQLNVYTADSKQRPVTINKMTKDEMHRVTHFSPKKM